MMNRGFSTWVMSKLVMVIFLFSLVAALSEYYMIYQDKTVDDTAKKFVQSIAEDVSDALSYRTTTRTIWLDSMIWIRDTSKQYSIYLKYIPDVDYNLGRLVILMVWNDHESIDEIKSFASAAGVSILHSGASNEDLAYAVDDVCLFEMDSNGELTQVLGEQGLLIRPSSIDDDYRSNYIIIYKDGNKLCIANNNVNVDLKTGISNLKSACENDAMC